MKVKFCCQCAKPLEEGTNFCPRCGWKIVCADSLDKNKDEKSGLDHQKYGPPQKEIYPENKDDRQRLDGKSSGSDSREDKKGSGRAASGARYIKDVQQIGSNYAGTSTKAGGKKSVNRDRLIVGISFGILFFLIIVFTAGGFLLARSMGDDYTFEVFGQNYRILTPAEVFGFRYSDTGQTSYPKTEEDAGPDSFIPGQDDIGAD